MLTVERVLARGHWDAAAAFDHISLDFDERHRRRFSYATHCGTAFLLNLPRATVLQHGDALQLSDGRLISVHAAPEALMAVRAGVGVPLVRLAWHIGNRHLPAEIHDDHILLREDHVIHAMLIGLGAAVERVDAPFTPEQGAYAGQGHGHGHHDHHDDEDHHHHHEHESHHAHHAH